MEKFVVQKVVGSDTELVEGELPEDEAVGASIWEREAGGARRSDDSILLAGLQEDVDIVCEGGGRRLVLGWLKNM